MHIRVLTRDNEMQKIIKVSTKERCTRDKYLDKHIDRDRKRCIEEEIEIALYRRRDRLL